MVWDFKIEAISVGSRVPRAMLEKSSSNPQSGLGLQISLGLYILTPHLTSLLLACKFPSSPFQGYSCLDHLVIQLLSHVWLFVTPQTAAFQAPLSFTISQTLLKFMSIESVILFNLLILCCLLLLWPSIFPRIRVFSSESVLRIRWPKYWSFSFSLSPSNEYSGLISFRIDWFDLLVVQGTLKSLPQHHSSKVSIPWHSTFFGSTLTSVHDYWKNHSLDYTDLCQQSDVSAF